MCPKLVHPTEVNCQHYHPTLKVVTVQSTNTTRTQTHHITNKHINLDRIESLLTLGTLVVTTLGITRVVKTYEYRPEMYHFSGRTINLFVRYRNTKTRYLVIISNPDLRTISFLGTRMRMCIAQGVHRRLVRVRRLSVNISTILIKKVRYRYCTTLIDDEDDDVLMINIINYVDDDVLIILPMIYLTNAYGAFLFACVKLPLPGKSLDFFLTFWLLFMTFYYSWIFLTVEKRRTWRYLFYSSYHSDISFFYSSWRGWVDWVGGWGVF